ncbi:iron dicitrate transporter FecR [Flavobacterium palustre]|uniref:Iron dicitrate transporter FecR n=1 Tax=Flavobacterium palustre TaxID=1476463 RepID=A0ABQ1HSG4_9FLAO|nr:FecR family protein [Flavobacterium palustre]GGA88152.1 iron dicitrate transporter FecR [Flavobacterium palustre]
MISNRIENIIAKFLTSQASASELSELELWIEDANNLEMFNRYVKINYAIEYNMKEFDSYGVKSKLQEAFARENKERKLKKLRKIIYYSAAAVVLGIVTTTYFYRLGLFDKPVATPVVVKNTIEAGTDKAILTLEDGSAVVLEKDKTYQKNNVVSNGKELVYDSKNKTQSALVYNYLTIPRGGQFQIKLSDGTKVWLNSETKLKFPVAFKEGSTRQVELVYGEAFFDVSPSSEHNGAKFKVLNKSQEVEVLGTEFNIKAYEDEDKIYTTLVEGKVAVSNSNSKKHLIPNQQSIVNLKNGNMAVNPIDAYNEVLWTKGIFSFKGKSLKEIMNVMSRWYDFQVVFQNPELEKVKFNGVLSKNDNIKEILSIIKKTNFINEYEIKDQKIIIK